MMYARTLSMNHASIAAHDDQIGEVTCTVYTRLELLSHLTHTQRKSTTAPS